jgi:hypothetical protein
VRLAAGRHYDGATSRGGADRNFGEALPLGDGEQARLGGRPSRDGGFLRACSLISERTSSSIRSRETA